MPSSLAGYAHTSLGAAVSTPFELSSELWAPSDTSIYVTRSAPTPCIAPKPSFIVGGDDDDEIATYITNICLNLDFVLQKSAKQLQVFGLICLQDLDR